MLKKRRTYDIMNMIRAFSGNKYKKSDLLTEMLSLQQEMVNLTFGEIQGETLNLKIYDVEKYLIQKNKEYNNVAEKELEIFVNESKTFCNLIKAEISGKRGEAKAFRSLQNICSKNIVLKNIELTDGNQRTELDAVVITPAGITIIEVKNTAKNIYIDENGDYYRTGEYLRWDCNIGEKMLLKESLLKKVIMREGIHDIPIQKIVVFTNNRIEIHNKYTMIRTCFASQLAYLIDGFRNGSYRAETEMNQLKEMIEAADKKEAYPFDFDVEQYKMDFAIVKTVLEDAEDAINYPKGHELRSRKVIISISNIFKSFIQRKHTQHDSGTSTISGMRSIEKGGVAS